MLDISRNGLPVIGEPREMLSAVLKQRVKPCCVGGRERPQHDTRATRSQLHSSILRHMSTRFDHWIKRDASHPS